jgi:K+-transporting ATPase c subunit
MIGTPRNIVEAGLEGAVACASPFALFGIAKILFAGATKAAIVATATALGGPALFGLAFGVGLYLLTRPSSRRNSKSGPNLDS